MVRVKEMLSSKGNTTPPVTDEQAMYTQGAYICSTRTISLNHSYLILFGMHKSSSCGGVINGFGPVLSYILLIIYSKRKKLLGSG
jgi:hypothetical protein